jgi:lambda family phage portal protein
VARILPPGADVRFSTPGQGLAQAVDFLRAQDREIAAGAGLTYEALTGDMAQATYSSARVSALDFRRRAEMLHRTVIEAQFLRPLWRRWQEVRALAGDFAPSDLPARLTVKFVAPGWPWVDPLKEVNADAAAVAAGFKSRQEVIAARGRDPDEVAEELAAEGWRPAPGADPPPDDARDDRMEARP